MKTIKVKTDSGIQDVKVRRSFRLFGVDWSVVNYTRTDNSSRTAYKMEWQTTGVFETSTGMMLPIYSEIPKRLKDWEIRAAKEIEKHIKTEKEMQEHLLQFEIIN